MTAIESATYDAAAAERRAELRHKPAYRDLAARLVVEVPR